MSAAAPALIHFASSNVMAGEKASVSSTLMLPSGQGQGIVDGQDLMAHFDQPHSVQLKHVDPRLPSGTLLTALLFVKGRRGACRRTEQLQVYIIA